MEITFGGALVILLGIVIMAGAMLIGYFLPPDGWDAIWLAVLFAIGFAATMGGSEMQK